MPLLHSFWQLLLANIDGNALPTWPKETEREGTELGARINMPFGFHHVSPTVIWIFHDVQDAMPETEWTDFSFFKDVFIYLKGRVTPREKDRERESFSIYWFIS